MSQTKERKKKGKNRRKGNGENTSSELPFKPIQKQLKTIQSNINDKSPKEKQSINISSFGTPMYETQIQFINMPQQMQNIQCPNFSKTSPTVPLFHRYTNSPQNVQGMQPMMHQSANMNPITNNTDKFDKLVAKVDEICCMR